MNSPCEQICSFFGHRDVENTVPLQQKIEDTIEELIKKGVTTFYFGGFGDFDSYCHTAVSKLRESNKNIRRVYCLSDERFLNPRKRPKYLKDEDYEEFTYLPLDYDYWYTRLYYRNCEMINQSDYVVFYVRNAENSGAFKCLTYAKKQKKNIIEL